MVSQEHETLSNLVTSRAGGRGKLTYVELAERSVDERSGYRPSANLLWKIAVGQDVKVNQKLIRAVAAGLGYPLERVAAAAAYQYLGYVASPVGGGVVVHEPGDAEGVHPKSREVLDRWAEEEHS